MIGFGCMRLSTRAKRDDDQAVEVLIAALDAGATLLDTANVYCRDDTDLGHNERLIARALETWSGDRDLITIATKGGLTRPDGKWIPDGRAKSLQAACEASLRALDTDCIDLYQLHAVDPRNAITTSVRALAKLRQQGLVRDIGLCNVNVSQIEQARALVDIASVQVALSTYESTSLRNGVAAYCRRHDIQLIAHSPLGGPRKRRRHGPASMLAYLCDLATHITPIPGATTVDHARTAVAAQQRRLDDDERQQIDASMPAARLLRVPMAQRRPDADADGDVVLIIGYPAAGKTTIAEQLVADGYARLNRDDRGGKLSSLVPALNELLASGARRVVLDNTYPERAARSDVIETAWRHGVPVRCVWLQTSLEQAQINAIRRMLTRHGRLLSGDELSGAKHANTFGPLAQFGYRRKFEQPAADEGFSAIEARSFEPQTSDHDVRALVLDIGDAALPAQAGQVVDALVADGYLRVDLPSCPHGGGPPKCWCRKPLPGLIIEAMEHQRIAPELSIYVGTKPADRRLAERLGFDYRELAQLGGS